MRLNVIKQLRNFILKLYVYTKAITLLYIIDYYIRNTSNFVQNQVPVKATLNRFLIVVIDSLNAVDEKRHVLFRLWHQVSRLQLTID